MRVRYTLALDTGAVDECALADHLEGFDKGASRAKEIRRLAIAGFKSQVEKKNDEVVHFETLDPGVQQLILGMLSGNAGGGLMQQIISAATQAQQAIPMQQPVQQPMQPVQQPVHQPIQQPAQKTVEQPVQQPIQQPVSNNEDYAETENKNSSEKQDIEERGNSTNSQTKNSDNLSKNENKDDVGQSNNVQNNENNIEEISTKDLIVDELTEEDPSLYDMDSEEDVDLDEDIDDPLLGFSID